MTPETHKQGEMLQGAHHRMTAELRLWEGAHEAPPMFGAHIENALATRIPIDLWLGLKNGMVRHLQERIAANRKQFEAL